MIDNNFNDLWPLFNVLVHKSSNEFQILKELIKRSYYSKASKIEIHFYYNLNYGLCIEVIDDGEEISFENLKEFFSIDSIIDCHNKKDKIDSSILLNCDTIEIKSGTTTSCYTVKLSSSFEKYDSIFIKDGLLKYIKSKKAVFQGTKITIKGYNLDNINTFYRNIFFDDESSVRKIYNYKKVEDYLLWNTSVGNLKKIFYPLYSYGEKYYEFVGTQPKIIIVDKISNKTIEINTQSIGIDESYEGLNNITEDESDSYPRSSNMCYKFKKYHIKKTINGTTVSFYLYGYVAGEKYRLLKCNLKENESLSDRFGLYLAKNFVNFKKENSLLNDCNSEHFKIIISSDNFILSPDGKEVTNINSKEVKWIFNESKKIIQSDIIPKAYNNYFRIRQDEEFNEKYKKQLYNKD